MSKNSITLSEEHADALKEGLSKGRRAKSLVLPPANLEILEQELYEDNEETSNDRPIPATRVHDPGGTRDDIEAGK